MGFRRFLGAAALVVALSPLTGCARPAPAPATRGLAQTAPALCAVIAPAGAYATRLHGVVVRRGGTTLGEAYFAGPDRESGEIMNRRRDFDADDLQGMRSISKSVVGLLVGVALADGKIPSLDTPALDLLPDRAVDDPRKRAITVRHLLMMSAGLKWSESTLVSPFSDETRMEFSRDMTNYVLKRPVAKAPNAHFLYNSGATVLLAEILQAQTGQPLDVYAREKLFTPLGIDKAIWTRGRDGRPMAHSGLRMRPRDLATLGALLLAEGNWHGRQIVPAAYVRESLAPHLKAELDWRYGYQWRLGETEANGRRWRWAGAFGNGGQRLFLVPDADLVVVITAGRYNMAPRENGLPSQQLFARILEETTRSAPPE